MKPMESTRPKFAAEDAKALALRLWKVKGTARETSQREGPKFPHARRKRRRICS